MQPVYLDSEVPEKEAKSRYKFAEFIMMENAASALENFILSLPDFSNSLNLLIICGTGNNGGDGYALGRKLYGKCFPEILQIGEPKTSEAKQQFQMAQAVGVKIFFEQPQVLDLSKYSLIVDCLYGTGFHGEFSSEINQLMEKINSFSSTKIACDIPSGIDKFGNTEPNSFFANYTITMGAYKLSQFSDSAKNLCGKIIVADLGISSKVFNSCGTADAFLITKDDCKLPFRTNKASHKGTYGHTVVYSGEKSGAAILSATAAMKFGSGLTSLLRTPESNLEQFKISPSLMITNKIPDKTTAIVIGNGLGIPDFQTIENFTNWFKNTKNPACVIDADLFSYSKLYALLQDLNKVPNAKIVLTPHPKELQQLANNLKIANRTDYTIQEVLNNRIHIGKEICQNYPSITLVLKSANTFIINKNQVFICAEGTQALAKGGSGDILAGMIGALLSQGYTAEQAAITACYTHGHISNKGVFGTEDFSLTPEILISNLL